MVSICSPYKAIGFDWSGVVFFHSANYPQAIKAFFGIERTDFQPVYFQYNHLLNTGDHNVTDVWGKILAHFGKEAEAPAFVAYLEGLPPGKIHTEMVDLAVQLKEKGYKIGLLSNNSLAGARVARAHGIDDIFGVTIFSAEVGCMKPQKAVYELFAERLGVNVTDLIFIDDSPKSLEGAENIGYLPILYQDLEKLKCRLSEVLKIDL
jgi:putative hydrolase of the HAD superfamily